MSKAHFVFGDLLCLWEWGHAHHCNDLYSHCWSKVPNNRASSLSRQHSTNSYFLKQNYDFSHVISWYLIMCGKCTIFRYFRQFTFMWKSSFAIFQSLLLQEDVVNFDRCLSMSMIFFSWRLDLCLVWPQKANIGHKENGSLSSMKSSPTAQQFFLRKKLYESFSSWKC